MSDRARPELDPEIREGPVSRHVAGTPGAPTTPPRSTIRLGVVGYMGPENAHPFSWSAIVNGSYNADVMPLYANKRIATYLDANRDSLGIDGARVTHVWTQDRVISERIVAASRVPHIAHEPRTMVEAVDAVLIARDDPESHAALAQPFLEAGLPVLVDKPLAATESDLAYFSDQARAGRLIMSCSSMRYAPEVRVLKEAATSLGPVRLVAAVGVKDWVSYGVHVLEAICTVLDDPRALRVRLDSFGNGDVAEIEFDGGRHRDHPPAPQRRADDATAPVRRGRLPFRGAGRAVRRAPRHAPPVHPLRHRRQGSAAVRHHPQRDRHPAGRPAQQGTAGSLGRAGLISFARRPPRRGAGPWSDR